MLILQFGVLRKKRDLRVLLYAFCFDREDQSKHILSTYIFLTSFPAYSIDQSFFLTSFPQRARFQRFARVTHFPRWAAFAYFPAVGNIYTRLLHWDNSLPFLPPITQVPVLYTNHRRFFTFSLIWWLFSSPARKAYYFWRFDCALCLYR